MTTEIDTTNPRVSAVFLLCFVAMLGVFQLYHGVFAADHYDQSFDVSRFPTPANVPSIGQDFAGPWYGASRLSRGEGLYHTHAAGAPNPRAATYVYPPLVAVLYRPLARWSTEHAFRFHTVFLFACFLLSMMAMGKTCALAPEEYAYALAIGLLSCPFHFEYERGNCHTPVVMMLLVAFFFWLQRRDNLVAGFFFALAALFKIYPALVLIYFLIKRQYRLVLWTVLFAAVLVQLTGGLTLYRQYAELVLRYNARVAEGDPDNHATHSAILMALEPVWGNVIAARCALAINALLVGGALVYFYVRRVVRNPLLLCLEFSAILLLANIIPNRSYRYTLVFLPFVIITLARGLEHKAIAARLGKWHMLVSVALAILCNFLLMAPLGGYHTAGTYNIVYRLLDWTTLAMLRQSWYGLLVLFIALLTVHQVISSTVNEQRRDNATSSECSLESTEDTGETGRKSRLMRYAMRGFVALVLFYVFVNSAGLRF